MKLPDVLGIINGGSDCWFRPVSWKGRGEAYCLKNGRTAFVPTATGGTYEMTYCPEELMGDWEITNADIVLGELSNG